MSDRDPGLSTRAVGGWKQMPEVSQHPASPPLYQAATFIFDDIDDFASVAQTKISGGYLYSRWANPTVDMLGRVITSLEGAEATACFASGMGAIAATLLSLVSSGDHVVADGRAVLGKQLHELCDERLGRQADRARVVADVGTPEEAARPLRGITAFERGEERKLDLGGVDDRLERDAPALALRAEAGPESMTADQQPSRLKKR